MVCWSSLIFLQVFIWECGKFLSRAGRHEEAFCCCSQCLHSSSCSFQKWPNKKSVIVGIANIDTVVGLPEMVNQLSNGKRIIYKESNSLFVISPFTCFDTDMKKQQEINKFMLKGKEVLLVVFVCFSFLLSQ